MPTPNFATPTTTISTNLTISATSAAEDIGLQKVRSDSETDIPVGGAAAKSTELSSPKRPSSSSSTLQTLTAPGHRL
ncbi:hypothetical protein MRB53_026867 [Persea americana]|uniref:Uncharacterized protein n=1 Tax=Persea americana TaxID=3435 RepID=A0ACC2LKL4_PERAE|nr:hypothetical protein MRB53_026867 [Persea americana]